MPKVQCDNCKKQFKVREEQFGQRAKCSSCGHRFVLSPSEGSAQGPPAQASENQPEAVPVEEPVAEAIEVKASGFLRSGKLMPTMVAIGPAVLNLDGDAITLECKPSSFGRLVSVGMKIFVFLAIILTPSLIVYFVLRQEKSGLFSAAVAGIVGSGVIGVLKILIPDDRMDGFFSKAAKGNVEIVKIEEKDVRAVNENPARDHAWNIAGNKQATFSFLCIISDDARVLAAIKRLKNEVKNRA